MRVEFRSMEQANFYLRLCEEILKAHLTAPRGKRLPKLRQKDRPARGRGYVEVCDLVAHMNLVKLAEGWIHHGNAILEPAFVKGFRLAIEAAAESGFACHSLPTVLACLAIDEVRRTEEQFATRRDRGPNTEEQHH
jgi:hypothetical protein